MQDFIQRFNKEAILTYEYSGKSSKLTVDRFF